jgi:uncharacterized protein YndB with AHSA1/START domain
VVAVAHGPEAADSPGENVVIEHTVRAAAVPEEVFAYFTDPAKVVRWIGAQAALDPRGGGLCRIQMSGGATMLGEFVAVDPYRRIVLTWGFVGDLFEMPPGSTAVAVSFAPDGRTTILRVTHTELPSPSVSAHQAGWEHYLRRLVIAAGGADPGPDSWRVTTDRQ